jgi:riboflavin synthase
MTTSWFKAILGKAEMFTGLIKEIGRVVRLTRVSGGARLAVEAPGLAREANRGDSVDVNGACLTVVEINGSRMIFDVSPETLSLTNIGQLTPGGVVNLEDSLTPSSRMGGHYVLGHVDGLGLITARKSSGDNVIMTIKLPRELEKYLVSKGSISVDGISLTINEVRGGSFTVNLIPETLRMTTLGGKKNNQTVNLEVDILAKYVEKFLAQGKNP